MLSVAPEDIYARKRLITCLKAQGRVKDAIAATIDQLEIFSTDAELWHELTMLYASECAFTKAVCASEELLLTDPSSFYNLLVHAELMASSGDWLLARKYYCKCLQYRSDEARALWGLLACLIETKPPPKLSDPMHAKLMCETKNRLTNAYTAIDTLSARSALSILKKV